MSRSGYYEGGPESQEEQWAHIRWRGAVKAAMRGKRGQAFLREMADALDAMPEKKLERDVLVDQSGECCAMGAVAIARGLDTSKVDPDDREDVAELFGIAPALAAEIAFENDECWGTRSSEDRWRYMREWVRSRIEGDGELDAQSGRFHEEAGCGS